MAAITPQTDVYLLKVPLEIDNENQLTFADAAAQYNYFNGLTGKIELEKFTYQRKDGVIRVELNIDDIIEYNYVMYRNTAYSTKWFYAYITGMEYLNDSVTAISIKTDVFQTWQFDLTYKSCFVEREHVNDDTVGLHTIPENVETGDSYVTNGTVTNFGVTVSGVADYCIVVDVSMIENPGTNQTLTYSWITPGDTTPSQYVNGTPSGLYHLIVGYNQSVVTSARAVIDVYDKAGLGDAIQNVYVLPKDLVGEVQSGLTISTTGSAEPANIGGLSMPKYSTDATTITGSSTYTRPTTIDGYTPKNNKLLCYPYNYLNVSNNAGSVIPYRYEEFTSGTPTFTIEGALCPGGSVKAVPQNYKGIGTSENSYDYSINGAKYPICAWVTDSYTNWLTQNAVNMSVEAETFGLSTLGNAFKGIATGGAVGGLLSAGVGLVNTLNKAQDMYGRTATANVVPDQAKGNLNAGDIVWSKWRSQFTYLPMSIKAEYARAADGFFSAYGYKVNSLKIPNVTGRTNWNFVKTVGCYIDANIPQDDLQEIKDLFDRGITFWHNPTTFRDYSQSNGIVSP